VFLILFLRIHSFFLVQKNKDSTMASTEDNDMGEEVAAMEEPAVRPNVKRLHSSHDSGMESEYEFDGMERN
jgi:hypothetical protein